MFSNFKRIILGHKIISGFAVTAVIFTFYFVYKSATDTSKQTRYVLAAVAKETIVSSISGSGQVAVLNQLDIKPKISGDIIYVGVKNSQEVKAGAILAEIDSLNAHKAVRDAQINLENAQIALSKLKLNQKADKPKLEDSVQTAQNNLSQAYQNGFSDVADAFLDLPNVLTGIRGILYDSTVGANGQINSGAYQNLMDQYNIFKLITMINQADADYNLSAKKYDGNLNIYKSTTRYSNSEQTSSLINETLETAKTMAQSVKDEQNILDTVVLSIKQYQSSRLVPSAIVQYQSDISGYITKLNGHINILTSIQNSVTSNQQSLASSQRALETAQQSNPLDIASEENSVKQRQTALWDAQDDLANYFIRAPFAGVVAKINVKKGDSVSIAAIVATLLGKQRLAEISLNEVDVAKIKIGQKATLTFDAIPGLTITGEVAEIDTIGTIAQGVVTYAVKIVFDTQDERVKPSMSVSAAIVTAVKTDTLVVPNSAVKSQNQGSYVEIPNQGEGQVTGDASGAGLNANGNFSSGAASIGGIVLKSQPGRQQVEVGVSNDDSTEILSGLKEGDQIIIKSVQPGISQNTQTQTRSLFQVPGTGGGSRGVSH